MHSAPAATARLGINGAARWAWRRLPHGGSLPIEEWQRRHKALLAILWLNAVALPMYSLASAGHSLLSAVVHGLAIVAFALPAGSARFSPRARSVFVSLGLLTAAALMVHISGGLIETHFYFFVVIVALTLYEDWVPFLIAVLYVLIHHGVLGTLAPAGVFNHGAAIAHPWRWAGIHALFVAMAGAAGVVAWRLNEDVRARMLATQKQLETFSETDILTGLGNRRKLMSDITEVFASGREAVFVLLDLDGFKTYNDTFGHPAGDKLLARLGRSLQEAAGPESQVYRLGGDEFCVVLHAPPQRMAAVEALAAAALSDRGEGFVITASYGSAALPSEAGTREAALRTADQRMYARKTSTRPSPRTQSRDVLVATLAERHPDLGPHIDGVTALAGAVAEQLGIAEHHVQEIRHAARLHDIGKLAIPDAIINKPGPLSDEEWGFMRRHTLIGERILGAAPSLAPVARLVRWSHERWDGEGYPDGLAAEHIPIGARIISVCDAFDAMTSERAYRAALSPADALAELDRCAGSQFDPEVVRAFRQTLSEPVESVASSVKALYSG